MRLLLSRCSGTSSKRCLWIIYLYAHLSHETCGITTISSQGNWGAERCVKPFAQRSPVHWKRPRPKHRLLARCPRSTLAVLACHGPEEGRLCKGGPTITRHLVTTCQKLILGEVCGCACPHAKGRGRLHPGWTRLNEHVKQLGFDPTQKVLWLRSSAFKTGFLGMFVCQQGAEWIFLFIYGNLKL